MSDSASTPLPWLTVPRLVIGVAGISLIMMVAGTCLLYSTTGPLPPPRDPPPPPNQSAVTSYRYKEGFYRSLVEDDAGKVGLGHDAYTKLRRVNPHFVEFTGNQVLRPGKDSLETRHLKIQATRRKLWVGEEGQGFKALHLVLRIENKTDKFLAYRVITKVPGRCTRKGILEHNALAVSPQEVIQRTECMSTGARAVRVTRVEVMELSPLGYYYVSRLDPVRLQYDRRTAEGHHISGGFPPCKLLPWQTIQIAFQRGQGEWYDVVDFYSRHSCDEYTFFSSYKRLAEKPERLPIRTPKSDD